MKKIFIFTLVSAPLFAFAQISAGIQDASSGIKFFQDLLQSATQIILALAVVYFMWNAFKYVKSGGDEEGKSEARDKMVYGIIGIAVMVSLWGLVAFLTKTANLSPTGAVTPPALPGIR